MYFKLPSRLTMIIFTKKDFEFFDSVTFRSSILIIFIYTLLNICTLYLK